MYYRMSETPEDVRKWFFKEVEKLWPLAGGSLSLRKNRCIRRTVQCVGVEKGILLMHYTHARR